ncbi:ABC transporter substrate-binding protein [Gordonia sp. NB41Y]|uniref:ABC transporter substrate-binding protein n=1 Tax=Gordonia sp. NB41Y TaxID=875808 RepID=UPI0006B1DC55|nr:ABC transporter substrate-binding protein [Gordonia sp. NB41Y]EMP12690.2 ABC transporter substrate-binding protein [Gordonia sp. NB41Y]WLP93135.1 ABC transporter substrate-binding protein [Gordonia sp. NB41Y]
MVATLALATALVVGACSSPAEDNGGATAPAPEAGAIPVTIEHQYGSTTIDEPVTRVAAMGVGDADTLLALGVQPTTIAPFADPTQRVTPWNAELLGDNQPVILPNVSAEFGAMIPKTLATDPQLITAVGAAPDRAQYDKLTAAVPTIVRPANYPDWQVPWDVQATEIGKAVGQPKAVADKIAQVKAQLASIRTDHPEFAGKTAVAVTRSADGSISVYGAGDGRGQTLIDYGLAFPESLKSTITSGFYGTLSPENVSMLDAADIVVAIDWQGSNAKLQSDAAWNRQPFVTGKRVAYLDQQVGSAMSVPTVLTIPWVASQAVEPIATAATEVR